MKFLKKTARQLRLVITLLLSSQLILQQHTLMYI